VAVNCGAIPTELTEAELFGHVKGAYTHAHSTRAGLVREAEGGTLFLDEIDSLPYGAQAKLLRFLQEKEYRPVGSNQVMHADVRVIAATNRNPTQLAARGAFRQDLLFRLNVLTLHLPLLRDRQSDIPSLALYFLRGTPVAKARAVAERAYIEQLLASNGGNVTHAARAAKKNRRAFFELMRKYKIDSDAYREGVVGEGAVGRGTLGGSAFGEGAFGE